MTHERGGVFDDAVARRCLRESIALARGDRAFDLVAAVLLPDHLHVVFTLPPGDSDFSVRVAAIKARFSRRWVASGGGERAQSASRDRQGYRGIWQKRFWEHTVRDADDLAHCVNYFHYNPVKHGYSTCPHAWEWSTFHRFVREQRYAADWHCACGGVPAQPPVADIRGAEMD
ncbi:MAG TPA: transposase [Tepidisphaeraceae bacterium]|nr:transposase [Tepidisphaeraceae bacterium]